MMDLDAQFHARTHYMQYEYVRKTSQEKKKVIFMSDLCNLKTF